MFLYFCCTLLRDCSCFVATFGQLSPCDPLIFSFSPTLDAHSLLKIEFFSNFHGYFLKKEQRKRNFQAKEVSKHRGKKLFFALSFALNQTFFLQFPLDIVKRHAEKKKFYCWLKNIEPGERNRRFWTPILMFIFHEKCQTLGHVKMQNLPCNTPLFLVFWPHPEPP